MNLSAPFIARPVATTLLTVGIALAGALAFFRLPVSPLPQVDFPTISITAQLPGASPDTVATSVASPLERHLGEIADVTEMTSQSSVGQARITLQFGLDRDIDGAARDVQAAINAAHADLPTSLKSNPTYRKVNPADAPILILALTSKTLTRGQLYDAASNVLEQSLSQLSGIGQVIIGGSALPAVRVELNPGALFKYGIGLEDVRAALASANANSPKGAIEQGARRYQIYTNDQASTAADYVPLVVAYRNGAAVRLSDVADVQDSVEDLRNAGFANGQPSVLVILFRQPGANIIDTVDGVKAELPHLMAAMPRDVDLTLASDRTTTIRASLFDTERTLVIAVCLVTMVVFLFLRDLRATLIPFIAVPVSIIGTFGAMYLLGFSLDNLSLMALTVATGFVVDDAIVVLENIERYLEEGMPRVQAALRGASEVGFTVLSISLSLIAVFIPILLMGGIVGRLFREFALTLSLAILVSLLISLTTTPMMCSLFLRSRKGQHRPLLFDRLLAGYERTLGWALRHGVLVMLSLFATIAVGWGLVIIIPKGLFPEQDTGRLTGSITADQSISFQAMQAKLAELMDIVQHDRAVDEVVGFGGGGGGGRSQTNSASVYVALKPVAQRSDTATQVIARLRRALSHVAGATLYLQAVQDIRVGGRQSNAEYQYTLQGDSTAEVYQWAPRLLAALQKNPVLTDVNSDQQQKGLETDITYDRDTIARLGLTPIEIDNTLYDAFGQRQVSTIYSALNQYHVVMEVAPRYWQRPETLKDIYVSTAGGTASGTQTTNALPGTVTVVTSAATAVSAATSASAASVRNAATNALANVGKGTASSGAAVSTARETMVPLSAFTHYGPGNTPLAVNHQGLFVATTLSFNLAPGKSLSDATAAIAEASRQIGIPATIHGTFAGTAQVFQQSLDSEPVLILAALGAVYIVLGILYESFVHPITILSTIPSAGVGAVLALMLFNIEFSIIALIGIILLIGIVKKNAIMMIDFAIAAERHRPRHSARRDLPGLPAAVPSDHDDDDGGDAGRGAAGAEFRRRRRNPSSARYLHRRRADHQPTADVVHDTGAVSLHGPVPAVGAAALGTRVSVAGFRRAGSRGMRRPVRYAALALSLLAAGCKVGPNYARPSAPTTPAFKELAGWKPSDPRDGIDRGAWWSIYGDAELDGLERQVEVSNQNVIEAAAAYRQAVALIQEARSGLFPVLSVTPGVTRAQNGGGSGGSAGFGGGPHTQYSVEGNASWDLDVWGKIRRQIESQSAAAQVNAADLANAKLSAQGSLATAYFELRAADSLTKLLSDTVADYRHALAITQNQYDAGTAARSDVLAADVQLQSTVALLVAAGVSRAQYEHAIAVLAGKPPADLTIPAALLTSDVPVVPPGVPSALLERRPDIAAAERTMQQQNALIGAAVAAYYPDISLSAVFGFAGDPLSKLFSVGNEVWSLGASATETLYQGGFQGAAVAAARATYDEAVATYRQTVLSAFQQVEDNLSDLRILQQQADAEDRTVKAAHSAVNVALNEYQAGTVAYTSVITEQAALLSAQQAQLSVQQSRLVDSVALIQALGGGWEATQLPPSASEGLLPVPPP